MRVKSRPACVASAVALGLGGCAGVPSVRAGPPCDGGGLVGEVVRQSVDRLARCSPVQAIRTATEGEQRDYGLVRLEALGPVALDAFRPAVTYAAYDRADRLGASTTSSAARRARGSSPRGASARCGRGPPRM